MSDVDQVLSSMKHSDCGSIFAPESLQDVRDRLARINETGCMCGDDPHMNALHDLAITDVPALLALIAHLSERGAR